MKSFGDARLAVAKMHANKQHKNKFISGPKAMHEFAFRLHEDLVNLSKELVLSKSEKAEVDVMIRMAQDEVDRTNDLINARLKKDADYVNSYGTGICKSKHWSPHTP